MSQNLMYEICDALDPVWGQGDLAVHSIYHRPEMEQMSGRRQVTFGEVYREPVTLEGLYHLGRVSNHLRTDDDKTRMSSKQRKTLIGSTRRDAATTVTSFVKVLGAEESPKGMAQY